MPSRAALLQVCFILFNEICPGRHPTVKGRPQTDNRCAVCERPVETDNDEYCHVHTAALGNLRKAYATWLEAYGKLPFREYLARLSKLSETGEQVKELAKFLVQHPERWNK